MAKKFRFSDDKTGDSACTPARKGRLSKRVGPGTRKRTTSCSLPLLRLEHRLNTGKSKCYDQTHAKEPLLDSHISPSSCVCTGFKLDRSHSSAGQLHASNEARAPIHYHVLSSIPARQTRSILHSIAVWPTPTVLYCRARSTGCRRSNRRV